MPFCPHSAGDYRGGLGRGKLRANGHPRGGPWRQCHWTSCAGSFLETPGPLFHGTQAAVELIVRVFAGWAAGLGSRATARGVEVDAHTGWQWGGAAAEQLRAFSASFLCARPVEQRPRDALSAGLRARKAGESNDAEARKRRARAPAWVGTALAPPSKLLGGARAAAAPWRWPSAWCSRGPRGWHQAVHRWC
jgi:hypothetical protein